jgi:type I restriction enzyme S subunit
MVHRKAWPLNTALYVRDFFGNSPYLVFYTLKNMGLETFNSGAGVPTLNRNHINGIRIAVPDRDLQGRFDSIVSPIHEQKEQVKKANAILTSAREALLPRLISGKLSVENLDINYPPGMAEELNAEPAVSTHA